MIRLSTHPSVDFIDNRMSEVDSSLDIPTDYRYNHTLEIYVPQRPLALIVQPNKEMKNQEIMFLDALQKYEQSSNGNSVVAFSKEDVTSWADVLRHANTAAENYREAGTKKKGFKGELRGLVRKLEGAKAYAEPWMRLLPSESWQGSLVCGGISAILEVRYYSASNPTLLSLLRRQQVDLEQFAKIHTRPCKRYPSVSRWHMLGFN